jgi:hypothetical protein
MDAQFPAALQMLFRPKRYKVMWGGRGAGRSWGVARALLPGDHTSGYSVFVSCRNRSRSLCIRSCLIRT